MLTHPQFDPIALQLGPLGIHWYGLMYLIGFLSLLWLGNGGQARNPNAAGNPPKWTTSCSTAHWA